MSRRILFVLSQTADTLIAEETLDALLVAAVFELKVALLLEGEAVRMVEDVEPPSEFSALREKLHSLPDYGVRSLHACADSIQRLEIKRLRPELSVELVTTDKYHEFLSSFEAVIPG